MNRLTVMIQNQSGHHAVHFKSTCSGGSLLPINSSWLGNTGMDHPVESQWNHRFFCQNVREKRILKLVNHILFFLTESIAPGTKYLCFCRCFNLSAGIQQIPSDLVLFMSCNWGNWGVGWSTWILGRRFLKGEGWDPNQLCDYPPQN